MHARWQREPRSRQDWDGKETSTPGTGTRGLADLDAGHQRATVEESQRRQQGVVSLNE
jgi:hypothetical protein